MIPVVPSLLYNISPTEWNMLQLCQLKVYHLSGGDKSVNFENKQLYLMFCIITKNYFEKHPHRNNESIMFGAWNPTIM